jgi:hypothetical protein
MQHEQKGKGRNITPIVGAGSDQIRIIYLKEYEKEKCITVGL